VNNLRPSVILFVTYGQVWDNILTDVAWNTRIDGEDVPPGVGAELAPVLDESTYPVS